jgi:hypothetical protein
MEIVNRSEIKNFVKGIIIITIVFLAVPVIFYFTNFGTSELSESESVWGAFGDFIGGTVGTFLNLIAAFLSLIGVYITLKIATRIHESENEFNQNNIIRETTRFNKEIELIHKQNKPYPDIEILSYHDKLQISIVNYGIGPLIIKDLQIKYNDRINYKFLYQALEANVNLDRCKAYYNTSSVLTLSPDHSKRLILIEGNKEGSELSKLLDDCIKHLMKCEIVVIFEDIFENKYQTNFKLQEMLIE